MTITMGVIVITRPAVIIAPVPGIGCQHPQSWSIQPFIRQLYSHPVVLPSMHGLHPILIIFLVFCSHPLQSQEILYQPS